MEDNRFYFRQLLSGRDFAVGNDFATQMVNFSYAIGDRATGACLLVDPAWHVNDLVDIVEADGKRKKYVGGQNSWVIDSLVEDDVLVVELFGKIIKGTFIGDNLGTAISVNTGGTGVVIDGSIRDDERVRQLPFNVLCRGTHPTAIGEVTMADMNGPIRIGDVTCMPGDIVLAKEAGVVIIPPQYAKEVVESSENVRLRDYWGKKTIADGKYTPGEVDRAWSAKMEKEFAKWKKEINTIEVFEQL